MPDLVEHGVLDPLDGGHTHAKRHASRDLAHDPLDAANRLEVSAGQLGADGLVAAANVVADTGR
jgi:hypothetical protein